MPVIAIVAYKLLAARLLLLCVPKFGSYIMSCRPPAEGQGSAAAKALPPADEALVRGVVGCALARLQLALEGESCFFAASWVLEQGRPHYLHGCLWGRGGRRF